MIFGEAREQTGGLNKSCSYSYDMINMIPWYRMVGMKCLISLLFWCYLVLRYWPIVFGLLPKSLAFHWVSIWWEHHNIIFLVCNQIAVQRFLWEERKICRTCEELRFRIEPDFQRVLIFWLVVWNMFYSPIYWDITQRWNPRSPSMVICSRKITPRFFRSLPQGHLSTGTSQRCILALGEPELLPFFGRGKNRMVLTVGNLNW